MNVDIGAKGLTCTFHLMACSWNPTSFQLGNLKEKVQDVKFVGYKTFSVQTVLLTCSTSSPQARLGDFFNNPILSF